MDKIFNFYSDNYELLCPILGDILLEFNDTQNYSDNNILQLNYSTSKNQYYFFLIHDNKMVTYKNNLDEYPIYYFNNDNFTKIANNSYEFFRRWFTKDQLSMFNKK